MKCEIITGNLPQLWQNLLQQLEAHNYCPKTIRYYREGVGKIDRFMQLGGFVEYTEQIGEHFLQTYQKRESVFYKSPKEYMKWCVNRLNDLLIEKEFAVQHHFSAAQQPVLFKDIFLEFVEYLQNQGLCEQTVRLQARYCAEFLVFLESENMPSLEKIKPSNIYDAFLASSSKISFGTSARKFLQFLYQRQIHAINLSVFVPEVHRPQPMPSTYTKEEISRMLKVIDRTTPKGLRDYAIILLASCLGIRVSDICNLEFTHIRRRERVIKFIQMKTEVPVSLELLPEIEDAIDAYVQSGRPDSDSQKIFLRATRPYLPIGRSAVAHIVENYLSAAGINTTGKKHGAHALRMSLATELINEDIPYSVVQKVLGQQHPESFKHYIRLDVERLRTCALEVPAPSNRLLQWLEQGGAC